LPVYAINERFAVQWLRLRLRARPLPHPVRRPLNNNTSFTAAGHSRGDKAHLQWVTGEAGGPLPCASDAVKMDRWKRVGEDGERDPRVR
jgi:hypothetical protein